MKVIFLYSESKSAPWLEQITKEYEKKLNAFIKVEQIKVKSSKLSRQEAEAKKEIESKEFLKKINEKDFLCVLDEAGTFLKSSREYAKKISHILGLGKQRVVFLIGGAFGFSEAIYDRADLKLSLSSLTMSHQIARLVLIEQTYRAFTILKGIPYHND